MYTIPPKTQPDYQQWHEEVTIFLQLYNSILKMYDITEIPYSNRKRTNIHIAWWNCSCFICVHSLHCATWPDCTWVGLPGEFPLQHVVHAKLHIFHVSDLAITLEKILAHLSVISPFFLCCFGSSTSLCERFPFCSKRVTQFHFWRGHTDDVFTSDMQQTLAPIKSSLSQKETKQVVCFCPGLQTTFITDISSKYWNLFFHFLVVLHADIRTLKQWNTVLNFNPITTFLVLLAAKWFISAVNTS